MKQTTPQIPEQSYDHWLGLVHRTIKLKSPADAEPIARLCAEQRMGTWHAAATYYGNLKLCPCGFCLRLRAELVRERGGEAHTERDRT